jgi:ribosomal protein L37AE/L43A
MAILAGVLGAGLAAACVVLGRRIVRQNAELEAMGRALVQEKKRPLPPTPPRLVESRRESFALLWFPALTVDEEKKLVLSASAGLPHCAKCLRAMTLSKEPPEEWVCAGCRDRRAGTAADFTVSDSVLTDALKEFFARHPDYRPDPGLALPKQVRG